MSSRAATDTMTVVDAATRLVEPWREVAVTIREAGRRKCEVEESMPGCEVPNSGGEQRARCGVVPRQCNPAFEIGRIGYEPTFESVERLGKTSEVPGIGVRSKVHVERVVATAMRLDRRAADQNESDVLLGEGCEQRLAFAIYATGVCRLSHA